MKPRKIIEDEISFEINSPEINSSISNKIENLNSENSLRQTIISYINYLEGCKTRFKNLHWAEHIKSRHETIDDVIDLITDFEDKLAESYQGGTSSFEPLDIEAEKIGFTCPIELSMDVKERTQILRQTLDEFGDFSGEVSLIDDFLLDLKIKGNYLMRMD